MDIHLIDGTFELFRSYFGAPKTAAPDGLEVGATKGFLRTMTRLEDSGATHIAVAFDHVIESFRNDLFAGYKTGEGIEPDLWNQSELLEEAAAALGYVVWPMVEFEADDAIAAAAWKYAEDPDVQRVLMCSPDKDMAQVVRGERIVMFDRIRDTVIDEAAVLAKWGIAPASIPDWLALVGDKADGIPGVPRWGAKSASTVLARWGRADAIPQDPADWDVKVRGAKTLALNLNAEREAVDLYRLLATLRADVPIAESAQDLRVTGPDWDRLHALCTRIGDERFFDRRRRAQGHD